MGFQRLSERVEGKSRAPGRRSPGGRSFHSRGPAAEKPYHRVCYVFVAQAASACHCAFGSNPYKAFGQSI